MKRENIVEAIIPMAMAAATKKVSDPNVAAMAKSRSTR